MTAEDVAFAKGETYKEMGLLREAIAEFETALSDGSLKYRATRRIASCLVALNLHDQAERVLLRSLCLPDVSKKDRLWIYSDLADFYENQGKPEAALERLTQIRHEDEFFFEDLSERIAALSRKIDFSAFDKPSAELEALLAAEVLADSGADAVPSVPPAAQGMTLDARRRALRHRFSGLVQYSFDQTVWNKGYANDISSSGIFVLTHQPVPVGSIVFLKIDLPASVGAAGLEIIGQVVRQENKLHDKGAALGMGVHFIALDRPLKKSLGSLMDELLNDEKEADRKAAVIRCHCDACGRILTFAESLAGQEAECSCGKAVAVPVTQHTPTPGNPLRGFHLAGCRIDRVIGRGSVATVYKGHHLTLDIPVAIKILSPAQKKTGSQFAERFLKEARVIARINHANIVAVMNAGEESGHKFIIMQFVPGVSLAQVLGKPGTLTSQSFIRIFLDVCNALQAAHEHSVVHGDVKPANILLTSGDRAMLVDFGLVKDLTTYEESENRGIAMGTPLYMSPEQARGEHAVDFRSDIYSLAATMYHMLAGRPPYGGMTAAEVIRKHMEDPFPMPTELSLPVPGRIWDILAKGMEKKPQNRYQSIEELKQDLLQVSRDVAVEEFKPLYSSMKKQKTKPAS